MGLKMPCAKKKTSGIVVKPMKSKATCSRNWWNQQRPRQLGDCLSLSLSNICYAPGQSQGLRPKGGGRMDGLHNLTDFRYKFVDLRVCHDQRRCDFQHLKVIAAHLGEYSFITKEVHHQHLSKHSRVNPLKSLIGSAQHPLPRRLEFNAAEKALATYVFDHFISCQGFLQALSQIE